MTKFAAAYFAELKKLAIGLPLAPPVPPVSPSAWGLTKSVIGKTLGNGMLAEQGTDLGLNLAGFKDQPMDAPRLKQFTRSAIPGAVGGAFVGGPIGSLAGAAITSGASAYSRLKTLADQQKQLAKPIAKENLAMSLILQNGGNLDAVGPAVKRHVFDGQIAQEAFDAKLQAAKQVEESSSSSPSRGALMSVPPPASAPAMPPTPATAPTSSLLRYAPWALAGGAAAGGIIAWARNRQKQKEQEALSKRHPLAGRYPGIFGRTA